MTQDVTPIGTLIDQLQEKRNEKRVLDKQVKDLADEIVDLRIRIRETMDVLGLETASGKTLSVSTKDTNIGQIEDIDSFYDFIRENDALYFLERRVSQAAFQEFVEHHEGELPPGLTVFVKQDLNLRKK